MAAVIASAVVPTLIANAAFLPRHLLPDRAILEEGAIPLAAPEATRVEEEEEGLQNE